MPGIFSQIRKRISRWAPRFVLVVIVVMVVFGAAAHASVALLMEEPFGTFGAINPTGHAAIYLNRVCAESLTRLRPCRQGEFGVVISRYHRVRGYDWIAIPLIPYLYAVNDVSDVPNTMDREQETELREAYRREYLMDIASDGKDGEKPKGDWIQLIGSSYDRTIHGFELNTTSEEDERFIALFNDRRNISHFNLFFHNCADFSKDVLDTYFPHSIHRNFIADAGLTTPKQVARSLVKYGKKHPELEMSAFVIPQVPGTIKRSHSVDGVIESLIKSKKYLVPMAVLNPGVAAGLIAAYMTNGRMSMPKYAAVFNVEEEQVGVEVAHNGTVPSSGGVTATSAVVPIRPSSMR